jgi:hypothetical protein
MTLAAAQSKEFEKITKKVSEPISFPFPITRTVETENYYQKEQSKRKSSFDVISPL